VLLAAGSPAEEARRAPFASTNTHEGIALHGYDPVACFELGRGIARPHASLERGDLPIRFGAQPARFTLVAAAAALAAYRRLVE